MPYFIGIDLGTSSLKVIISDHNGIIIAQSSEPYQYDVPSRGYAEQDPDVWWRACCKCTKSVLGKIDNQGIDIRGVSFSGQMHGVVFLDQNMAPVRPAILHCDTRTASLLNYIDHVFKVKGVDTLNPLYTGFLLPSLVWVKEHEPDNFAKTRFVCLPKDFLKLRMCGELTSDFSDASATLAFDIERFEWSQEILSLFELAEEIFPPCYESAYPVGRVTKAAAAATGLPYGVLVVNGGGDQVMQSIGNGAIGQGTATVNIGSSGQICFQSDSLIANPFRNTNTFCSYMKNKWITMGATMCAGLSLKWFSHVLGDIDIDALDQDIANIVPGSGGIVFLPYLNGERTPHMDPNLSGAFVGINLETDAAHMAKAIMEGVAYSLMDCIEECKNLGLQANQLIASGGGARSRNWLQIQSDIFGVPLKTAVNKEQAATGAAIVAAVGSGTFSSIQEACRQMVRYNDYAYFPSHVRHSIYMKYYEIFRRVLSACHSEMNDLTVLGKQNTV